MAFPAGSTTNVSLSTDSLNSLEDITATLNSGSNTVGNVTNFNASSGILAATTPLLAANYTAFGSQVCRAATIYNNSGVSIKVQKGGSGEYLTIPDGDSRYFSAITNMNQLAVSLLADSSTASRVEALWES